MHLLQAGGSFAVDAAQDDTVGVPASRRGSLHYNSGMSLGGIIRTITRGKATMLEPGEDAPDFDVTDHQGNRVKLSDFRGRRVVLWFYPKADTPG